MAHRDRTRRFGDDPSAQVLAEILELVERRLPDLPTDDPVAESLARLVPVLAGALDRHAHHAPPPSTPLHELNVSWRTYHALLGAGITTVEQLAGLSHGERAAVYGIGRKALQSISSALAEFEEQR